jgi:hypothetical protein
MKGKYSAAALRTVLAIAAAGSVAAALPCLASCSRSSRSAGQAAVPSGSAPQTPPLPAAQTSAAPQQEVKNGNQKLTAKPSAPLAAQLRAFGLGAASKPRTAWDFSLGPLQSFRPESEELTGALSVARAFMDGLASGKLDQKLLLPEARDALSVLLAPSPRKAEKDEPEGNAAARGYRLGAIVVSGEDASLKVRLPAAALPSDGGEAVRVEGLLSLRRVDDAWFVESLALDPAASGALAFDPGAVGQSGGSRGANDGD